MRKTLDTYEIWSDYGQGPECTTGSESFTDARRLLREYRENQPEFRHWIKTVRVPNPDYVQTAFERIICPVECRRGAPMGRSDVILPPGSEKETSERIYDRRVPLDSGGYDKGGAYWGVGAELRVRYTKSLSLVKFYRVER